MDHVAAPTVIGGDGSGINDFPPCATLFVESWCTATTATKVAECACAVCGCLVVVDHIGTFPETDFDLSVLCRMDVTKTDVSEGEPPSGLPVLYGPARRVQGGVAMIDVCTTCAAALCHQRLPKEALANGLWIGDVPHELAQLNFMEQLLVTRVWHNYFVTQVTKGQRKLCANAVVFSQPTAKVVSVLPPCRAEMDECMAVIFLGCSLPTTADFKCTPFLVRQHVVYDALRWLQRNHSDYHDIFISLANLEGYSSDMPPVALVCKRTDGTAPAEALAVNELDEERGVELGPCAFTVHGLTGAEFTNMTYEEKKVAALQHLERGGTAMGIGHSSEPESIFHNPKLYTRWVGLKIL
ncbi:hypothetical protein A0H81_08558 [Grifola frondosa]|uniref:DUF6570 domain-containing protein n=1 Tax=Grifola frondosa TaxID=5627 RepID=A0A1C7M4G2_GRIFR|nr:hypothetical protein A0H81_08558 [Grifola frondosa]